MNNRLIQLLLGLLLTMAAGTANATVISYQATDLGGDTWRYDYSVSNDSLGAPLTEFLIDFDNGLYELLSPAPRPDWLTQTADPVWDATGPQNGFFDAIALGAGIAPGETAAGFSVSFLWLNPGTVPADQAFTVIGDGGIVDSGWTVPASEPAPVPEPSTLLLLGGGLLAVVARKKFSGKFEPAT